MSEEWGFCKRCAFEVPVEDGVLDEHHRDNFGGGKRLCMGTGLRPTPRPGPEAEPVQVVDFYKTVGQIAARRRTRDAREIRRANAAKAAKVYLEVKGSGGD